MKTSILTKTKKSLAALGLVVSVLAGLIASTAIAQSAKPAMEPNETKMGVIGPRIVGGQPAEANKARWITSLQFDGEHFCGGSLVRPDWVLTAAHCIVSESADNPSFSVWVGGYDLTQPDQGVRVDVSEIITHENYNDNTLQNDIALLRLASSVNTEIQPVKLATSAIMGGPAAPNQPVTVSGWGVLSEGGNIPDTLHEVQVPVVSNAICNAPESYAGEVGSSQICAGLRDGGKDSCQGDSGGPLWLNFEDQYYHIGVVSYGEGCAQANKYGVYTRTTSYTNWIESKIGGQSGNSTDNQEGPADNNTPIDISDDDLSEMCSAMFPGAQAILEGEENNIIQLDSFDQRFDLQGNANDEILFEITVPENSLVFEVSISGGEGDADLYLAYDRIPSVNDYDFAPFIDGNEESISVESPTAGRWYIMVHGYDRFEDVSLDVYSF